MSLLQPTLRAAEDGALGPGDGEWVVPQITKSNQGCLGEEYQSYHSLIPLSRGLNMAGSQKTSVLDLTHRHNWHFSLSHVYCSHLQLITTCDVLVTPTRAHPAMSFPKCMSAECIHVLIFLWLKEEEKYITDREENCSDAYRSRGWARAKHLWWQFRSNQDDKQVKCSGCFC